MCYIASSTSYRLRNSLLRQEHGIAAEHVNDVDLAGAEDHLVAQHARESGGAQAASLTGLLPRWVHDNPKPYVGHHWLK